VVELVGEVPEQDGGDVRIEERRVVAAALERIGLHHPPGGPRAVEAALADEVVEPVGADVLFGERAAAPLGVLVLAAHPDGGGIGHLFDEKRAAGGGGVLAHHVQRHAPPDAGAADAVFLDVAVGAADLVAPEEREGALGGGNAALHQIGGDAGHLGQGTHA